METIEQHLTATCELIKQKIFDGDFVFKSCTDHTCTVEIDGKYPFDLWIGNTVKDYFNFHFGFLDEMNFLSDHLKLTTQKDRLRAWRKVKPFVEDYKQTKLKREKQKEFNRLKKELEALNYKP